MTTKNKTSNQGNRFMKLSLKKNTLFNDEHNKLNRSSDVIILDESFDRLRADYNNDINPKKIHSPIVIDDSCEVSDNELPDVCFGGPSKAGNVSFNCSQESPQHSEAPSILGWSPAQNIIKATPNHNPIPSTPKDKADESFEQCSLKKVQQSQKKILNNLYGDSLKKVQNSQKKLLNDLYGDAWKSIPSLFKQKNLTQSNVTQFNGITKKLQFEDDEEKENIRSILKQNKELYLTYSDVKRPVNDTNVGDTTKKSKKKLYTEKVPNTPEVPKIKTKMRNINSTTKKTKITKAMSVTEIVGVMNRNVLTESNDNVENITKRIDNVDNIMKRIDNVENITKQIDGVESITREIDNTERISKKVDKVDSLTKRIQNVTVTPVEKSVQRLSFVGSLADNVPSWRCHTEAIKYRDNYKTLREELTRRLFVEFNKNVFDDKLDADMPILWDTKLRRTAGTTTNRQIKTANGDRIRTSIIKLSTKVLDACARLRDTLIHELCHAATWLVDHTLNAGHGPLWKKWAKKALRVYPELGEISRCHDMEIHYKYTYRCTKCGYSIERHSKSIDITKKACGYCRGTFEIVLNKKNKDGVVISTPARKGNTNEFAKFVKENYASQKEGKTHAQVMKLLGEQFSARKNNKFINT